MSKSPLSIRSLTVALMAPRHLSSDFVSISRSLASSYRTLTQKQIVTNSPVDLDGSAALKGTPEPKNVQEPWPVAITPFPHRDLLPRWNITLSVLCPFHLLLTLCCPLGSFEGSRRRRDFEQCTPYQCTNEELKRLRNVLTSPWPWEERADTNMLVPVRRQCLAVPWADSAPTTSPTTIPTTIPTQKAWRCLGPASQRGLRPEWAKLSLLH
ncbi:hypothetical protein FIE12Z_7177 [Fusarium flagelliforme]|uniref:Uncharacterized protein n=1 Tax=Fusarium flagelliforme TaxID=2675880 RepID=A0A395MLF6_9HYPO|nr:hypothetical protein FIE12Z_7177 [Fusarium flagelliforme]